MSTAVLGSLSFDSTPDVSGAPALVSDGTVSSLTAGITGSRPAAGVAGRVYIDTTLLGLFRDNGSSWDSLTQLISLTAVANQTAITQATSSTPAIIGLANNPVLPGTAGFVPPTGTTAQRAGTPTTGTTRWNTDLGYTEVYNGSVWTRQGQVLQTVTGTIGASSGTGVQLGANATPLQTAGNLIWSQSFTPVSNASKLIITFMVNGSNSVASNRMVLTVFAGNTCIGAFSVLAPATANGAFCIPVSVVYFPASTAAVTYTAKLGGVSAGTTFWSQTSASTLGGSMVTASTIQEIL